MYIARLIDKDLIEWKESQNHKPLLLRGARQVGKSSTVRHLALQFDHFIEVNFERQPELKALFPDNIDVKDIARKLGGLFNTPVIPGKTLIFLDEIQSCKNAIRSLWFFKEDFPELHLIAAGSLLEFTLKDIRSFGVGRVRSMFMHPLSFDEFLLAEGKESWLKAKQNADESHPLFDVMHKSLVEEFRKFMIIGGMPASVATWVNTHDYLACADEQEDIQQSYYDDFAKYSQNINPQLLRNTLHSVVSQIGGKFTFSKVEGGYRSEDVKKALALLCDAGIIKEVSHTAANGVPLGAEVNRKFKKYIYLDSGLLLRILDLQLGGSTELLKLIMIGSDEDLVNKGSLTEMIVGCEMLKYSSRRVQHDLFYWEAIDNGATSEVDYITSVNAAILPIEVKSGTSGKMKSLRLFMKKKGITDATRLSLENFGKIEYTESDGMSRRIHILPLYAVANLLKSEEYLPGCGE
ncbi:MAG: ATP-binding protein [Muribaculaceae bacterium]